MVKKILKNKVKKKKVPITVPVFQNLNGTMVLTQLGASTKKYRSTVYIPSPVTVKVIIFTVIFRALHARRKLLQFRNENNLFFYLGEMVCVSVVIKYSMFMRHS